MEKIWELHKMHLCGTVSLSKKKSRTVNDFPFHKMSNGALSRMKRGAMRRATRPIYTRPACAGCVDAGTRCTHRGRVKFVVQGLAWKDRKYVGFLSNVHINRADEGTFVKRWIASKRTRKNFQSHNVVKRYSRFMGAIDRIDRLVRDWGISRRGVRS